jgi:UDP-2,3-diacylglucosamine hydrolase
MVAGWGRFPTLFAEKARSLGQPLVCVGIRGHADPALAHQVDAFYWAGLLRLGRVIRCFKREGVQRVVLAGKIHKVHMHRRWRFLHFIPDWRTLRFWFNHKRATNGDDHLLLGIIDEFAADGLRVESALTLCPELLVRQGLLTRRAPTAAEEKDIRFGWHLAREMGRLDVGQSVAIKERAVLAVEAIEGTDRAIARAGELCPAGGFVVVKVAKPQQDMRFDVPTVGCNTVEAIHEAGGRVLAIEAGKTIVVDEAQTVALANRYGMTIVALNSGQWAVGSGQ